MMSAERRLLQGTNHYRDPHTTIGCLNLPSSSALTQRQSDKLHDLKLFCFLHRPGVSLIYSSGNNISVKATQQTMLICQHIDCVKITIFSSP